MAKTANAGFVFNFVAGAVPATIPAAPEYQENFRVRRQVADRISAPTTLNSMYFDQTKRQIIVICNDGKTRKCNVDRLPSRDVANALYKKLQQVGKKQEAVSFVAAGGYSPDTWFYAVQ